MPVPQSGDAEDELGGVSERRVQETAGRRPHPLREALGGISHGLRQWDQRRAGDEEDEGIVGREPVQEPGCRQEQPGGAPQPSRDHRCTLHGFESDAAVPFAPGHAALRFQHFQIAHHFRERQIELVLARVGMRCCRFS